MIDKFKYVDINNPSVETKSPLKNNEVQGQNYWTAKDANDVSEKINEVINVVNNNENAGITIDNTKDLKSNLGPISATSTQTTNGKKIATREDVGTAIYKTKNELEAKIKTNSDNLIENEVAILDLEYAATIISDKTKALETKDIEIDNNIKGIKATLAGIIESPTDKFKSAFRVWNATEEDERIHFIPKTLDANDEIVDLPADATDDDKKNALIMQVDIENVTADDNGKFNLVSDQALNIYWETDLLLGGTAKKSILDSKNIIVDDNAPTLILSYEANNARHNITADLKSDGKLTFYRENNLDGADWNNVYIVRIEENILANASDFALQLDLLDVDTKVELVNDKAQKALDATDLIKSDITNKFTRNSDKLTGNNTSENPGVAHIGRGYKGEQYHGDGATANQYYGSSAQGSQYYGYNSQGSILIGSTADKNTGSQRVLVDGTKLATFEEIIDAAKNKDAYVAADDALHTLITSEVEVELNKKVNKDLSDVNVGTTHEGKWLTIKSGGIAFADAPSGGSGTSNVTQAEKDIWNGKQDALSQAQLAVIDGAAVSTADKQKWNGKQDALSGNQLLVLNGVPVSANEKATWTAKQSALSKPQLDVINGQAVSVTEKATWNGKQNSLNPSQLEVVNGKPFTQAEKDKLAGLTSGGTGTGGGTTNLNNLEIIKIKDYATEVDLFKKLNSIGGENKDYYSVILITDDIEFVPSIESAVLGNIYIASYTKNGPTSDTDYGELFLKCYNIRNSLDTLSISIRSKGAGGSESSNDYKFDIDSVFVDNSTERINNSSYISLKDSVNGEEDFFERIITDYYYNVGSTFLVDLHTHIVNTDPSWNQEIQNKIDTTGVLTINSIEVADNSNVKTILSGDYTSMSVTKIDDDNTRIDIVGITSPTWLELVANGGDFIFEFKEEIKTENYVLKFTDENSNVVNAQLKYSQTHVFQANKKYKFSNFAEPINVTNGPEKMKINLFGKLISYDGTIKDITASVSRFSSNEDNFTYSIVSNSGGGTSGGNFTENSDALVANANGNPQDVAKIGWNYTGTIQLGNADTDNGQIINIGGSNVSTLSITAKDGNNASIAANDSTGNLVVTTFNQIGSVVNQLTGSTITFTDDTTMVL